MVRQAPLSSAKMLLHAEIFTPYRRSGPPFATNNDPNLSMSLVVRTFVKFGFLGSPANARWT
jgi:hypothetical protein